MRQGVRLLIGVSSLIACGRSEIFFSSATGDVITSNPDAGACIANAKTTPEGVIVATYRPAE